MPHKNPEAAKAYARNYYRKHKEQIVARVRRTNFIRKAKHRQEGLCLDCGQPSGMVRCSSCNLDRQIDRQLHLLATNQFEEFKQAKDDMRRQLFPAIWDRKLNKEHQRGLAWALHLHRLRHSEEETECLV